MADSSELRWVEQHWPLRNEFEQSMFVSIAAMLADDVFDDPDPIARANERFPLILHIHVGAMSDDDLVDWCSDDLERMIVAGDYSDRANLERHFIVWCEGVFAEMLSYATAEPPSP